MRDLTLDRAADGHGWLLGDAGSGFWLGREGVRHTLAALDSATPPDRLGTLILTELLGSAEVAPRPRDTVDALVQAVTRRPPVELARLAPLVLDAAPGGRATGRRDHGGGRRPAHRQRRVGSGRRTTPARSCSAAGSSPETPRSPGRSARCSRRAGRRHRCATAGDGALAAAWLAARTLPEVTDPAALHRRLFRPAG